MSGKTFTFVRFLALSVLAPALSWGQIVVETYAIKFVCGTLPSPLPAALDGPVVAGTYATSINVHNPNFFPRSISFRKKVALTFPPREQKPGFVSDYKTDALGIDQALKIDCPDIAANFIPAPPPPFFEGFVVIESLGPFLFRLPYSLDVVAVYTARHTPDQVETIHIERYPARFQPRTIPAAAINKQIFTIRQSRYRIGYFGPPETPVKLIAFLDGKKVFEAVVGRTNAEGILIQSDNFTEAHVGKWRLVPVFELGQGEELQADPVEIEITP